MLKNMPESQPANGWRLARRRNVSGQPRLAFFRPDRRDLPAFIRQHLDEQARCLGQFFDVVLIEENCNYDEVCERIEPDLALFESGVYARPERRITNTHRQTHIPKLGLFNGDAFCSSRSVFLSDMDEWGVENFFGVSVALLGRLPSDLRRRFFVWPNFADSRLFHTYPEGKRTQILKTGSHASFYPWRNQVNRLLGEHFSMATLPHTGWVSAATTLGMTSGESYARALSGAMIVPACGSMSEELVRKHLEIPASGALLLTERTAAVESAGFVDMETCVFADETDVVDKVRFLLSNPDELTRISTAGQVLAHSRHDMAHRNQIFQWYALAKKAAAGEAIVQPGAFSDLTLQPDKGPIEPSTHRILVGRDARLIDKAENMLAAGGIEEARSSYHAVRNCYLEPEADLGLARTYLLTGNPELAREQVWSSIVRCIQWYDATEPDPVEWSVYILSLLCAGDVKGAAKAAGQYDRLTHHELARARHLTYELAGLQPPLAPDRVRASIHRNRNLSWRAWIDEAEKALAACGQTELAKRAEALTTEAKETVSAPNSPDGPRKVGRQSLQLQRLQKRHWYSRIRTRLQNRSWLKLRIRARVAQLLRLPPPGPTPANPFHEILSGRDVKAIVLVGISPEDRIGKWARDACRHTPAPCTLVMVGDPPGPHEPVSAILGRGHNALDADGVLSLTLSHQSLVVIGPAASRLMSHERFMGAGLVMLVGASDRAGSSPAEAFDRDVAWRRVSLESASNLNIIAWRASTEFRQQDTAGITNDHSRFAS